MIKTELLNAKTLVYKVHDEENYATCYFTLNLDTYELIISGECQASYKWNVTPEESFIDLMLRCEQEYLNTKFGYSIAQEFNLEKSIERTVENVKQWLEDEYDQGTIDRIVTRIKMIDCWGEESFYSELEDICYLAAQRDLIESCCVIVKENPYWLTRSIQYFCENVKPALEEYKKSHKI